MITYYEWLLSLIPEYKPDRISSKLYYKTFRWDDAISDDENRALQGKSFRDRYLMEQDLSQIVDAFKLHSTFSKEGANCLEVLVALSEQFFNLVSGISSAPKTKSGAFVLMLYNIGLLNAEESEYDLLIDKWLDNPSTIFLPNYNKSRRKKISIWREMLNYINNNYKI